MSFMASLIVIEELAKVDASVSVMVDVQVSDLDCKPQNVFSP